MKEKNPKSDDEDDGSNPTYEGSNSLNKSKKKGISSNCFNHSEKNSFKNKMGIMDNFLEKYNIDLLYFANKSEPEKRVESPEHCH